MPRHPRKILVLFPTPQLREDLEKMNPQQYQFHFLECEFLSTAPPRLMGDPSELTEYCERAVQYAKTHLIAGVFYNFDIGNLVAAAVCEACNLPGPSLISVMACYHKYLTRCLNQPAASDSMFFAQLQVDSSSIAFEELPSEFPFPVYVKPPCSSYGLLGRVIHTRSELAEICPEMAQQYEPWWEMIRVFAQRYLDDRYMLERATNENVGAVMKSKPLWRSGTVPLLVEPSIQGASLTTDGFVYQGQIHFWGIVDTVTTQQGAVDQYAFPTQLSEKDQAQVFSQARQVLHNVGLDNSFFSMEFWHLQDGTFLLQELNGRMSATFRQLYRNCLGIDLYKAALEICVGNNPTLGQPIENKNFNGVGCRLYLSSHQRGIAKDVLDFPIVSHLQEAAGYTFTLNVQENQNLEPQGFHPTPLLEVDLKGKDRTSLEYQGDYLRQLLLMEKRTIAYQLDVVLDNEYTLSGEGLVWDKYCHRLLWVDYERQALMQYDLQNEEWTSETLPIPAYSIGVESPKSLILGGSEGVFRWKRNPQSQDSLITIASSYQGKALSCNDLILDSQGRIYFGTIYEDDCRIEQPGALYRVETSGEISCLDEPIGYSNGLAFSPDEQTLYFQDSVARRIYAYDLDRATGDFVGKRTLVQVPEDEGVPDGLAVDSQGNLWSSQWFGARLVCYDGSDGSVLHTIALPHPHVASLTFTAREKPDLFVITSRMTWTAGQHLAPRSYADMPWVKSGPLYKIHLDLKDKD